MKYGTIQSQTAMSTKAEKYTGTLPHSVLMKLFSSYIFASLCIYQRKLRCHIFAPTHHLSKIPEYAQISYTRINLHLSSHPGTEEGKKKNERYKKVLYSTNI